jgi:hypothetical protein
MTDTPLYLAIGVPILANATMLLLIHTSLNRRIDDMKDLWRAELHRVEEVLDARLRHIEDRMGIGR